MADRPETKWRIAMRYFKSRTPKYVRDNPAKSLAMLLRTATDPIPPDVAKELADLLDPPRGWQIEPGLRFVVERSPSNLRLVEITNNEGKRICLRVRDKRLRGIGHELAVRHTAKLYGKSERYVERMYSKWMREFFIPGYDLTRQTADSLGPEFIQPAWVEFEKLAAPFRRRVAKIARKSSKEKSIKQL